MMTTLFFSRSLAPISSIALGFAFSYLGVPLGWLIGAAISTGTLAAMGKKILLPATIQRSGMIVLGTSTGLVVTPGVADLLLTWLPMMLISVALSTGLAIAVTGLYSRRANIDRATAFFSLLPGGVIEMANIGEKYAANRAVIGAMHAARAGMIVLCIPFIAGLLSPTSIESAVAQAPILAPHQYMVVILVGCAGGMVAHLLKFPAGWFLGPLLLISILSITGVFMAGSLPEPLVTVAQVIIGMSLGYKFRRDTIAQVPRALMAGLTIQLKIATAIGLLAILLSAYLAASPVTLLLGTAGGGIAEMVLAAKLLGESVELVAGFHTIRALLVNFLAGPIWKLMSRGSTREVE
jgi:uncharacterized protein